MEIFSGHLRKLTVSLDDPVRYSLPLDDQIVPLNERLNRIVGIRFTGNIHCIQCARKIRKSFQQGYCFPCLQRLMECNLCVIHPEKCNMQHQPCPDNDWAHMQCNQPHIVYLANSSGLKVGITRESQVPVRWIDQGAAQALPIYRTRNRYQCGMIEVCLKQWMNDRTDWRQLLKSAVTPLNLLQERDRLLQTAEIALTATMAAFPQEDIQFLPASEVQELCYPVPTYPQMLKILSLDKTPTLESRLLGIKGQYLLFEHGIINIRKYAGYHVEFTVK